MDKCNSCGNLARELTKGRCDRCDMKIDPGSWCDDDDDSLDAYDRLYYFGKLPFAETEDRLNCFGEMPFACGDCYLCACSTDGNCSAHYGYYQFMCYVCRPRY